MGAVVALDFETSGSQAHYACALGMTKIEAGVVTSWYRLIRPPSPYVRFTEIHGLTWDDLRDAPTFAELWPEISAFLSGATLLVAHNASFDRRVLLACCDAAGVEAPAIPFACTVKGSRRGLCLAHNRLNDVCAHLGIELDHHHAESDAAACARIYLHLRGLGLSDEDMMLK